MEVSLNTGGCSNVGITYTISFTFFRYKLLKYTKSHVPTALWNTVKGTIPRDFHLQFFV